MKLTKLNEYATAASSLTPKRDLHMHGLRSTLLRKTAEEETDIVARVVRGYRAWSSGYRPLSADDINKYIATAAPSDIDEAQVWKILTDWMETPDA